MIVIKIKRSIARITFAISDNNYHYDNNDTNYLYDKNDNNYHSDNDNHLDSNVHPLPTFPSLIRLRFLDSLTRGRRKRCRPVPCSSRAFV